MEEGPERRRTQHCACQLNAGLGDRRAEERQPRVPGNAGQARALGRPCPRSQLCRVPTPSSHIRNPLTVTLTLALLPGEGRRSPVLVDRLSRR